MPRPPKARTRVLDAAERIVKERGAAFLTFDELAATSGISRGGICYHFATKDELLRALIERDMQQWQEQEQRCRARLGAEGSDFIAELRAMTESNPEQRRFVAGMMSAVAHDRSLLEPVRQHEAKRAPSEWSAVEIDRHVLKLAAAGLFWTDIFGCMEIPVEQRGRIIARIEALAREWFPQDRQTPTPTVSDVVDTPTDP